MPKYIFTKNATLELPKNISNATYDSDSYGTQYIYEPSFTPILTSSYSSSEQYSSDKYREIKSLKNIINRKNGIDTAFNSDNIFNVSSSIISISSAYLGNGIEKGTVSLSYFYTGSLLAKATDSKENGVLYDLNNSKVGIVLYEHGFIILTSSSPITTNITGTFNSGEDFPRWCLFTELSSLEEQVNTSLGYNCLNKIPTMTIFAEAKKGELNHSNNSTYVQSGSYTLLSNTSNNFIESNKVSIKNTISSPFTGSNANFEKQTFITKIGLYNKDRQLIGIATLANPIRKTENREFLFKLQVDI
jgi:hypothetical protein